ncbi:hypothetical protein [Pedobacter sp. SYSU D00535]|uniref:hypothetical protein n=1 Tax=Pedobacter sp. SYSU D00535 TaxID=2810308 RepID=UPI001A95E866|nr:hypothetical protein [Pedobacter sp. SYSU D00535]
MNEDWRTEAPKLAAMERSNPFTVPENYFDTLSEQLQARINIENITASDTASGLTVPEDYFLSLEERIHLSVKLAQMKEQIPAEGFDIPEGYFDNLEQRILAQTTAVPMQQEAKVKRLFPTWIKYAAAACITAVIGVGVFMNNNRQNSPAAEAELSHIPEEEIVQYLQAYSAPGDGTMIVEHLSEAGDGKGSVGLEVPEKEIEEYLNSTL